MNDVKDKHMPYRFWSLCLKQVMLFLYAIPFILQFSCFKPLRRYQVKGLPTNTWNDINARSPHHLRLCNWCIWSVIMLPTPSSDRESLGTENFDWMTWGGNGVAIVVYKFWRQVSYFLATYCQLNNGFLLFYLLIHLYGVPHNAKVF